MVRIRMTRFGTTKRPFYRVMVADSRKATVGTTIEQVGHYDPLTKDKALTLDLARVDYWISKGAQPTDTVARLIKKARASGEAKV